MNGTGGIHQVGAQVAIANTGVVRGDIKVDFQLENSFRTEAFPLVTPTNDALPPTGPSGLLAASSRIVPFLGRQTELARLRAWRDEPGPLSVMLVHGPGGQGKTRLAAKFAQLCAADRWAVAQARHHTDPSIDTGEYEPATEADGLLVVIDYAERWPRADLERLFRAPFLRQGVPVRLMLLARPAGYWWQSLLNPLAKLNAQVADLPLGPLASDVTDRQKVFAAARDEFARRLEVAHVLDLRPAGSLTDEAYDLALTLHMAALVAVDAQRRGTVAPKRPADLSAYLIARERDHWATMYANGRITQPGRVMGRLVGLATFTRPLPNVAAATAVAEVGLADTAVSAQALLDDHAVCYPPASTGTMLEPLFPDRLGEDHIAELLSPVDGDGWSMDLPAKLITSGTNPRLPTTALTVLVETASRWEHVRQHHLFPLLRTHPELVRLATGASLVTLAEYADPEVLAELDARLPRETTVDLDAGSAAIAKRLAEHGIATASSAADRATLLNRLAVRSTKAGLYADALTAARQAVALRERLAANDPAHEPDLAAAVSTLAVALSSSGDANEATAVGRRAIELRRRLAAKDAEAYEPDLAVSLTNLSVFLSDSGDVDEAVPTAQESVDIYRRLVDGAARPYSADFAMAMANLGRALSQTGRYREGAQTAGEAVARFRALATSDSSFVPSLARTLVNLRVNLAGLDERVDTLSIAREAVELYRGLAVTLPGVYAPELAEALSALVVHLVDHRHDDEALVAAQEAVDILQELATIDPVGHEPRLARALTTLATALLAAGHTGSAVAANEKAVAIHRDHVPRDEAGFASALFHLSESLLAAGRNKRAVTVIEQAVALRRDKKNDDAGFADLLIRYSTALTAAGRASEAVIALREAAKTYRRLSADEPHYLVDLAEALVELAEKLADDEHYDEAATAAGEAVTIWREGVDAEPAAAEALIHCLRLLSVSLMHSGRLTEALAQNEELLGLMRTRSGEEPALLDDLGRKVLILLDLDRPDEAIAPSAEAVAGWRPLADSDPSSYEPYLASALSDRAVALFNTAQFAEAEVAAVEAVQLWSALTEEFTDYEEELEETTRTLADIRRIGGRSGPGASSATDAAIHISGLGQLRTDGNAPGRDAGYN